MTFCGLVGGGLGVGAPRAMASKEMDEGWLPEVSPPVFVHAPLLIISRFFGCHPRPFIPLHSTSPFVDPSF
jgi:hypothetical protein